MKLREGSKAFFVASTGQHVGKTTTCLGLFSGLKKRLHSVGYMKPVGQESVESEDGFLVDKDVLLFKDHFHLKSADEDMSPVLLPPGFTRNYLDGKVSDQEIRGAIEKAYESIVSDHKITLVEGTGHVSVGSIVNLNNAQVAALLKIPVILITTGGLGSAFDDLARNKAVCDKHGVPVKGVILNRVYPEKREMIIRYMSKALERWDIPLVGCIPYDPFLSNPSLKDFEDLFDTLLLTGDAHRMRHFRQTRLIATSIENYKDKIYPHQLIITPANREDVILATLEKQLQYDLKGGMILTGDDPPRAEIIERLEDADIPMLFAPVHSHTAMTMIASFTAKLCNEDVAKVKEAIDVVETHLNFDLLSTM